MSIKDDINHTRRQVDRIREQQIADKSPDNIRKWADRFSVPPSTQPSPSPPKWRAGTNLKEAGSNVLTDLFGVLFFLAAAYLLPEGAWIWFIAALILFFRMLAEIFNYFDLKN